MISPIDRVSNRATVYAACAVSLALGLFFIFVWSPLPWGWHGIDLYYELAQSLVHGDAFPTMERMWGYPYFLAGWYWWFGDRPWIPLCVQALANASIPLMIYTLVRLELSERIATVSAVLVGVFSFNTIYASTQASDALCTVLLVASVLAFALGGTRDRRVWFAASGLLAAAAFQFRPNLILFPFFAAACALVFRRQTARKVAHLCVFVMVFVVACVPWIVRNHSFSGLFIPASTHGSVQLWYGSLQVGPHRDNWVYNPRAAFENPPIDYSSIDRLPVIVTGNVQPCAGRSTARVRLTYWTNRDPAPRQLPAVPDAHGDFSLSLAPLEAPTALSYFFDTWSATDGVQTHASTPPGGASDPLLFVVSRDHLGDLDVAGDALDVFDLIRLTRHLSWHDALPFKERLDLNGNGGIDEGDLRRAAALLVDVQTPASGEIRDPVSRIDVDETSAAVRFRDGSSLSIPRQWSGSITSIEALGPTADSLVSRSRTFSSLRAGGVDAPIVAAPCLLLEHIGVNRVPYRREPHDMRRYLALALDNIRQDPAAFVVASAERAWRVFIIEGSTDTRTAAQFGGGSTVFKAGRAASIFCLALALAGLVVAIARGLPIFNVLVPIAYVPLTICFMLVNARYSMTVQPFVFVFVAVALVELTDRWRARL